MKRIGRLLQWVRSWRAPAAHQVLYGLLSEKDREIENLKELLRAINKRALPGEMDSLDALRSMYRERELYWNENRELWHKIEFARPSVQRDLYRCRALGESDEKRAYQLWFSELESLRERSRTRK